MATTAGVQALIGGLDPDLKLVFTRVFDYVLKNLRLGRVGQQATSENLQASFVEGTTPAVANTEFSIVHGRTVAPYLAVPVLDLTLAGSRIVPLAVSKPADANRIYLTSSETNRAIRLLVEGP